MYVSKHAASGRGFTGTWRPRQGHELIAQGGSHVAGHTLHLAWSLKHCWACAGRQLLKGHVRLLVSVFCLFVN